MVIPTTTFNSIIFFPIPHLIIEYLFQPPCICYFNLNNNYNSPSYDKFICHDVYSFLLVNKNTVKYMNQFELLKKPPPFYKIPNKYLSFFDISYVCSQHNLTFTHYTQLLSCIDVLLSKYNMLPVNVDDIPDDINNMINNLINTSNKEFIHTDDYNLSASFKNFIRCHCNRSINITQESCCNGLGFAISFNW